MKSKIYLALTSLLLTVQFTYGQGNLIYDQQSINLIEGSASYQPFGQSFTPTLSSVGFIMLNLFDSDAFNNNGATIFVNIRSSSITGTILGSSSAIFLPGSFFGIANFSFSDPIAVNPGTTYYFQPVIQSGDIFSAYVTDGSYLGGTAYNNGLAWPGHNLWFQEGIIVVPEPSSAWLALLGSGAWLFIRRQRAIN